MADRATLLALAERCEAATGPDRELDAEIHVAVGWALPDWMTTTTVDGARTGLLVGGKRLGAYTRSLDDALTLVPEGWFWTASLRRTPLGDRTGEGHVHNGGSHMGGDYRGQDVFGHTAALALCAACLRALAAQAEEGA